MEPFSYEHSFKFTQEQFVRLNSVFTKKNRPFRIAIASIIGIICLFWQYSLILGAAILVLVIINLISPQIIHGTAASTFKDTKYLHQELTYGVNEKTLWVKGSELNVEVGWPLIAVWDEREEWLKITATHAPSFWFQVVNLKEAGVYEKVIELCNKHATKFDS